MSQLPEVVFKFVSLATARLMLDNLTVRYTPLQELNDPAESPLFRGDDKLEKAGCFLLSQLPGMTQERCAEGARFFASRNLLDTTSIAARKWGVLCLAGADALAYSPMWSHYAEAHKGLAIGLSSAAKCLQGFNGLDSVDYSGAAKEGIEGFRSKLHCWSPESEYRAWKLLAPPWFSGNVEACNAELEKFDPADVKQIVLGSRCEAATWEYVRLWLKEHGQGDEIVRHCVLTPSGTLEVVSVPSEAVDTFFKNSEALREAHISEDDATWESNWQRLKGRIARER